jgi:hypothetical protein
MPEDKLTSEQVVRLLHAKAAELEHIAKQRMPEATDMYGVEYLTADIALIASLLADHIEATLKPPAVDVDPGYWVR